MYRYIFVILSFLIIMLISFVKTPYSNSQSSINPYFQPTNNPDYLANNEKILIILDSSYSMEELINRERKMDIARNAINEVLRQLPQNVWIGLRVYGHKAGFLGFNACRASELKVPIGPNNQALISNELLKIKPVGWTPISYSIQQAVEKDFNGLTGKKRIILVSDGMETCDGNPCDYVVSLVRKKIDLQVDVVGFDLTETAALSQLKCTALATKGKFYTANNPKEFSDSLSKILNVNKEVQGRILK